MNASSSREAHAEAGGRSGGEQTPDRALDGESRQRHSFFRTLALSSAPEAIYEPKERERHSLGKGRDGSPAPRSSPYTCLRNSFLGVQGGRARGPGPPGIGSQVPAAACTSRCIRGPGLSAGRRAIGWEEGSNLNCLLYSPNQGSPLIAGSS